jgi:hypothetical protein
MNNPIDKKLQDLKKKAQLSLSKTDDRGDDIEKYLIEAEEIREKSKRHNEEKVLLLEGKLKQEVDEINKKFESADDMSFKDKVEQLSKAYFKYASKKASLDRLGKETLFFDSITDTYVRVSWFKYETLNGKIEERLRTDRFKPNVIKKYIDLDSKRKIGMHIDGKLVNNIMREFRPYIKEFEPSKPKFYGDFFNTYTPNGFLDVRVTNTINMQKFTTVIAPVRYPRISALLENIAPFDGERVFLLNWLSTILNTAQKTRTAIILKGIQRTGKGVFTSKIIEYAMNEANCFTATNANLSDNFNNYLEDKLFIKFDEVKGDFHKDKDIANKIKLIVSEENISIRSMHTNPYMIRFYANCIFLSNEELPIPMDQSDERLSVIETKSKTLAEVAEEKFGEDMGTFISKVEEERDRFIIHLKMCNYNKQLASSTIKNKTKKAIQDATATTQSVLKTAFRSGDVETIADMLHEALEDTMHEVAIKGEKEIYKETMDGNFKVKKQFPFNHKNEVMMNHFISEMTSGQMSNTSLKWFSIAMNIEHILKSDRKFGDFWNLVLSSPITIKLKLGDNKIKMEKFRTISFHAKIDKFHFDGMEFVFTGKKTAERKTDELF